MVFEVIKRFTVASDVTLPELETAVWGPIRNCIEVCYKDVDIKASKPASSIPILYSIIWTQHGTANVHTKIILPQMHIHK